MEANRRPPRGLYKLWRSIRSRLSGPIAKRGAKNGHLAGLYYFLFNPSFRAEQKAFLSGVIGYHQSITAPEGSIAMLRRNVHRLEKGLLMRPRRTPFALNYIGETVHAFVTSRECDSSAIDQEEQRWAADVLHEYFSVHADEDQLSDLRRTFQEALEPTPAPTNTEKRRIPYLRDLSAPPPVSYPDLYQLARQRRSVRWYLQRPVERTMIDKAVTLAAQSPSACNRQPFEFRIFDDPELVQRVVSIPVGLTGYRHNVPVIVVVVGQQRHYFNERDRHLIYIDASLAVMGFVYALEAQGLSSCCVNWPDQEENESRMRQLIGLKSDERPVMLVSVGYPDPEGMVANSTKKPLPNLRRYNFE